VKRIFVAVLLSSFCSKGICRDGPKPSQGFIDVPGGPVWYKVTGSGPGIPLLALHGGPGGRSCGFALLEPLDTGLLWFGSRRLVLARDWCHGSRVEDAFHSGSAAARKIMESRLTHLSHPCCP